MYGMLAYHLAVTAFLLLMTINIGINWWVFVAPPARRFDGPGARPPLVSVLIPARNEALRITPCLRSLTAQDYPRYEVIVLNDHSEDTTVDVVMAHGFTRSKDSPRRLLEGEPLPVGWTGKSWACHQLAAAARGDYLLFTDADTAHDPPALGAMLGHALDTEAALLSAWAASGHGFLERTRRDPACLRAAFGGPAALSFETVAAPSRIRAWSVGGFPRSIGRGERSIPTFSPRRLRIHRRPRGGA